MTTHFDRLSAALADRYRIERELGAGGMATVYLATDVRHERQVAVKVLRHDLSASIGAERFLQEIRIAARLGHPHIVPLLDSGRVGGPGDESLYYVMTYVPGESLRERLAREGELPLHDAVRILRDVADALAHAHDQGVVHRDVKPENILLSGRHALVADFGVAKAVSDATGRSQVTTAGVALGTPAYMAPEQAAADPHVDHRADLYALGVVGYEMLTGEPPFTGTTPQQVLAAHVTEAPRPVTTRRPVVPPALADAIMRCLEKKPADRPQTAESLVLAFEAAHTPTGGTTPTETRPYAAVARVPRSRTRTLLVAAVALVVLGLVAAGVWWAGGLGEARGGSMVALRDRIQLTFTGQIRTPAISPDGTQLAYVTRRCSEGDCSYGVEVQDVGGSATRRVFDGATGIYWIEWSADRRHLLVAATYERRWGTHLVPVLGGAPRLLSSGPASGAAAGVFVASDTIVSANMVATDSTRWLRTETLAGVPVDSVPIETGGRQVASMAAVPGGRWLVLHLIDASDMEQLVVDRTGRIAGRRRVPFGFPRASSDAIWYAMGRQGNQAGVVRTGFDAGSGRLAGRSDTVYTGAFTNFSVSADGGTLVLDEGAAQYQIWALPVDALLAGTFPDTSRVLQGSIAVYGQASPDGELLLLGRPAPGADGRVYATRPWGGGAERRITIAPPPVRAFWDDAATLAVEAPAEGGTRLALVDVATGASRNAAVVPDEAVRDYEPLPGGGWMWIPGHGRELRLRREPGGAVRRVPVPAWFESAYAISSAPSGRLAIIGWNASTGDTVGFGELDPSNGAYTSWYTGSAEHADIRMHIDGSVLLTRWDAQESATLLHFTGPGEARLLGSVPRSVTSLSVSDDLRRATVVVEERFGDAWMMRVVR